MLQDETNTNIHNNASGLEPRHTSRKWFQWVTNSSRQYTEVRRDDNENNASDYIDRDNFNRSRVAPMEIETSHEMTSTARLETAYCYKFLQKCCLVLMILVLLVIMAAYVGGLLPKYRLPSKTCPPNLQDDLLISLLDLVLDKKARILSPSELKPLHGAHFGFVWDHEDNSTVQWRPQGITTLHTNTTKFLLVSWYGRIDQWYFNRGARISFVQIPSGVENKNVLSYCHVLLVDRHFEPFPFLHAGGLAMEPASQTLHVPDSRYPWSYQIHVFQILENIYRVPPCHAKRFFGYSYVLRESYSYRAPIKPSFLSYDWDRRRMVMGTFAHDCNKDTPWHVDTPEWRHNPENRLAWMDVDEKHSSIQSCAPVFGDMQGVASAKLSFENTTQSVLWVSSSYGATHESHVHIVAEFDPDIACTDDGLMKKDMSEYQTTVLSYPPGLEDLHIELDGSTRDVETAFAANSRKIWFLTEFGSRIVFCTQMDKLLPHHP